MIKIKILDKKPHKKEKRIENNTIEINKKIEEIFNEKILKLLMKIEETSKKRSERVFLVGGIVRDILLGIENKDIDIVVEGDAINFALELKEILGAEKIVVHEKFKTAVLTVTPTLKLDFASSRVEFYEYPASLPIVEYGSIEDDMYRRDFTINAMALEIKTKNYGNIKDFYNGYEDLKNKKIRVLHNLSFVDDPTRIIRAFRFASRYDFTLEKNTEKFLINAIKSGLLKKLSSSRLRHELEILFDEKQVENALYFLEKYKVLEEIHPMIKYDKKIDKKIKKLEKLKDILEKFRIEKRIMIFLILLENLKKKELELVLKKFEFSQKFIRKQGYGILEVNKILEDLKNKKLNSEIYLILSKHSIETILLLMLKNEEYSVDNRIKNYLFKTIHIKPLITGQDLLKYGEKPGVLFKQRLKSYFMLQLDNENLTKEELLKK